MPSRDQLLEVIAIQTEVAGLGLDLDLGRLLHLVAQRTLHLVQADGAAVEMSEGDEMVYRATAGIAEGALGLRLKRDQSLSGLCVAQGQALRCDDALTDPRTDHAACERLGLRSMVVVPLRHHGVTVGVLKAMSTRKAHFSDAQMTLLGLLSDLVAAATYFATSYSPSELFHKATHDGLTDLPNRSLFLDRLHASLAQARRDGQPLAVVMLDLDGLKPINDHFGHRAGDAALREFARRLLGVLRQSDTAARLGGDEFAVLLPLTAEGGPEATMRRLAERLNGRFDFEGHELLVGASMGAACFPQDGDEVSRLIELADQRMYVHKRRPQAAAA
ncbi:MULTISPECIES: GGDEF domain-containing protein [Roseateles]|uniref:Sensor domain-containing diguanylate cyclase n=1 Tax=Pelomonas caseinilytica TaxID=2906763 RepID=A0ABS8XJQ3_9BURK|nr:MULTISPECIES: sensor domain-containing diguanylate cyclase [unclassified Roseateles]MCE4538784.1 sensor domain-containing diguanylate cyclase [Pelomonas sp. P7]HEV6967269.1 sensor domain-containing diguanylate cyclase [Roseateles sp.]